ncbi:hypothetical protein RJT34_00183 [Clitoria ternatea]|uniref:C2H2-type domain-containing protein n=1 Tax=Clitoria ternatea TaxID=43366 RepID=A0AAN9KIX9_CLITE
MFSLHSSALSLPVSLCGTFSSLMKMVKKNGSSASKKVCRFCRREFTSANALGGHMRTHCKTRRVSKFTHRKKTQHLHSYATASYGNRVRLGGPNDDEVTIDLAKSLNGLGWKVHKKRDGRRKNNTHNSNCYSFVDDEYSFSNDDDQKLSEVLTWGGVNPSSAHKICKTRSTYKCVVCDQVFSTIHGVLRHAKDEQGEKEEEGQDEINFNGYDGYEADTEDCTSDDAGKARKSAAPVVPRMRALDLNEVPPKEEDSPKKED